MEDHAVYESLHKRKDGGSFYAVTDMTVFRSAAGEPLFRAAYFADISDRKRAELNLRHSEERFRAAAEAMGDVIWTTNSKGEMIGEQPGWAAFSGQSFEEYQGFGASQTIHPEDAALYREWERAVADPRKFTAEIRMRRHDGQYRLMSITAVPVFDEDGGVREWVGATDRYHRTAARARKKSGKATSGSRGSPRHSRNWCGRSKPDGNLEYANSLWREYTSIRRIRGRAGRSGMSCCIRKMPDRIWSAGANPWPRGRCLNRKSFAPCLRWQLPLVHLPGRCRSRPRQPDRPMAGRVHGH